MAVRIYRYRKPELTISLAAGGSLAANTMYYVTGFFKKSATYNSAVGQFADVQNITTDSVNKTIVVNWRVVIPVQSFTDAGSGRVRVTATNHCLAQGDTITIESGAYSGTTTITTWENYNTFLITKTFSGTYTTNIIVTANPNGSNGLELYCSTTAPFSGNPEVAGNWIGNNSNYSHYSWTAGYTTQNINITTPFTLNSYINHPQGVGSILQPPPFWSGTLRKGNIYMYCYGTTTMADIKQACIDADIQDIAYVTDDTFIFQGIFRVNGANCLSISDYVILSYGMFFGDQINAITYTRCQLNFQNVWYGAYYLATANYCNIQFLPSLYARTTWNNSSPYSYPLGNNNSFTSNEGTSAEGLPTVYNINGMVVNLNGTASKYIRMACSNSTMIMSNIRINKGVFYIYYINVPSNHRPVSDLYIVDSPNAYDIIVGSCTTPVGLRNVDTTRTDNKKIVAFSYTDPSIYTMTFYRYKTLNVKDFNGNIVTGATVNISSGDQVFTGVTDTSGNVTYEIIEEIASAAVGITNYQHFENWSVTVTKQGFYNYSAFSKIASAIDNSVVLNKLNVIPKSRLVNALT